MIPVEMRYLVAVAVIARGGMAYQADQVASQLATWATPPSNVSEAFFRLDMALNAAGLVQPMGGAQ